MSIHTLEDFVSRQYQEDLRGTLLSATFPWFLNQRTLPDGYALLDVAAQGTIVDTPQFTHTLHDGGAPASTFFGLVLPLLYFFTAKTGIATNHVVRVKANLTLPNPRTIGNVYLGPHVDYEFEDRSSFLTLIYYVNDSDGDTVVFNERAGAPVAIPSERLRVTPEQGKLVYFDGDIIHTGQNPTHTPARAVINLNVEAVAARAPPSQGAAGGRGVADDDQAGFAALPGGAEPRGGREGERAVAGPRRGADPASRGAPPPLPPLLPPDWLA